MLLLIGGLVLWSTTHLLVSTAPGLRSKLVDSIGLAPYKGIFSLVLVGAVVLMVIGWKCAPATSLWLPPAWTRHATMLLVPIAVVLFISSALPNDIKQIIRHPQLIGVKLWAVAHLLCNGELRSLVLFGGLLAWAVLEVIFINRRDGARVKPVKVGVMKTALSVAVGLALAAVLVYVHPWLSGMRLLPA